MVGPASRTSQTRPGAGSRQPARHIGIILALGPHKAADRQPVERELGAFTMKQGQYTRRQSKPKFFDFHFKQAGDDKMPEFMDEDHTREHGDKDQS